MSCLSVTVLCSVMKYTWVNQRTNCCLRGRRGSVQLQLVSSFSQLYSSNKHQGNQFGSYKTIVKLKPEGHHPTRLNGFMVCEANQYRNLHLRLCDFICICAHNRRSRRASGATRTTWDPSTETAHREGAPGRASLNEADEDETSSHLEFHLLPPTTATTPLPPERPLTLRSARPLSWLLNPKQPPARTTIGSMSEGR